MELYRGDRFANEHTMPGRYRFDGLHAKSFGRGDPAYIRREGLIKAVRQHINHPKPGDQAYYDVSDFISFSRDKDRALFWLRDKGKWLLRPCTVPYTETRYLFTMRIPQHELVLKDEGIYTYSFYCDTLMREPNADTLIDRAFSGTIDCPCVRSDTQHSIVLIDAVQFIKAHYDAATSADALALASQDQEWLVVPYDPLPPRGRPSRIQRAAFWSAELFNVDGEFRDPMAYAISGQEF